MACCAPFRRRKERRVELPVNEGVGVFDPVLVLGRARHFARCDAAPRLPVDLAGGDLVALLHRLGGGGQHLRIDKMAAPLAGDQEALVDQLLESQHHRAARHAEFLGKHPAGRQRHRRGDLPVEDGGHDRLADLGLQRLSGFCRNPEKSRPDCCVVPLCHGVSRGRI
jgi:hypothetical protein